MDKNIIGRLVRFPVDRCNFIDGRVTRVIDEARELIEVVPLDDPKEIWKGYKYQVEYING